MTLFCCGAWVRLWHEASEAKASNLRQLLGEQRKCMDGRPRLPSTRMTQSGPRGGCQFALQQRLDAYSITSSARPSSVNGKVIPSALAVLRLMINSTFVDWCTGRSLGFSPLRTRPV
jgi:hypothetical protein